VAAATATAMAVMAERACCLLLVPGPFVAFLMQ